MHTAFRTLAAASLAAVALNGFAETNPTVPSAGSSQGDFDITLNLTPYIIVNGFEDMTINAADTDVTQSDNICIGGFGFANFNVSFESQNGNAELGSPNPTDPFLLLDSSTSETIGYAVGFANSASAGAEDEASTDGTLTTDFPRSASATIANCLGGGENATLFVGVNAADWQDVEGQAFTDTLTVMVEAI